MTPRAGAVKEADDPELGDRQRGEELAGRKAEFDGGKRYLPGQQPNANSKAFQPEWTITGASNDYPEGEATTTATHVTTTDRRTR